ncbi:MAG: winged helix-turn-helix domain-containing protein [Planctomycetota bacterium]|nr:winged helix-turn-helix domain-containing protein [Planctomycetota bacterium]
MGEDVIRLDRNIDVHVRSIRKKLGEHRELIETVRGVGYRFKE